MTLTESMGTKHDLHELLAQVEDDTRLDGFREEFGGDEASLTGADTITWADTAQGLLDLTRDLTARFDNPVDPDYIAEQVRHEDEHAAVARTVGFRRIRYGLLVRERPGASPGSIRVDWKLCIQQVAPSRPVTKLLYAAIVAAPRCLSADDVEALRVMGYRDADDVARRIERWSSRSGIAIPIARAAC